MVICCCMHGWWLATFVPKVLIRYKIKKIWDYLVISNTVRQVVKRTCMYRRWSCPQGKKKIRKCRIWPGCYDVTRSGSCITLASDTKIHQQNRSKSDTTIHYTTAPIHRLMVSRQKLLYRQTISQYRCMPTPLICRCKELCRRTVRRIKYLIPTHPQTRNTNIIVCRQISNRRLMVC